MEDNSFSGDFEFEDFNNPQEILHQMILATGLNFNDTPDIEDVESILSKKGNCEIIYEQDFVLKIFKLPSNDTIATVFCPTKPANLNKLPQEEVKFKRQERINSMKEDLKTLVKEERFEEAYKTKSLIEELEQLQKFNPDDKVKEELKEKLEESSDEGEFKKKVDGLKNILNRLKDLLDDE